MKRNLAALALATALGAVGVVTGTAAPAHAATTSLTGHVVDSATHAPVANVVVTARDVVNHSVVYARAKTGPRGYFTLTNLTEEEFGLYVNGTAVSYEAGWVGCKHGVVQDWGAACSWGTGNGAMGNVYLDHK